MKKILIFTTSMIFLVGCGGGSDSGSNSGSGSKKDVNMVISQPYTAYPGNKVIKHTTKTLVQIAHIDGEDTSTILLVEGNATIIRNP